MSIFSRTSLYVTLLIFFFSSTFGQVNSVQFGRNRLQYKKFQYKFYQGKNFDTYITKGGNELGKYASKVAEEELPEIEKQVEYSLQKKVSLIVYNSYDEFRQSNIGLGIDYQANGGLTVLVNNKLVVYFDGNHEHLRYQIREGISRVLVENILFGDDLGEIASNQALLDLPKWLTDGYVAYIAKPWDAQLDDQLKREILDKGYRNFYQFAFVKPSLAGHAFWQYIAEQYKEANVTYFIYLARIYKSLNHASLKICKKKFKEVLSDFMEYEDSKYNDDLRQRRNAPKGQMVITEDVSKKELYRFQLNPIPKNEDYAVVEYKNGNYKTKLIQDYYDTKILIDKGVKTKLGDMNPNYPILAWDPKGTKLLVIYWEKGHIKMFVYDAAAGYKRNIQNLDYFDQVLDASYMIDDNTLLLSAVKNGHSDIYQYKIEEKTTLQITNDVYDDLNPVYVSYPNRTGIIFSSNRPGNNAPNTDTVVPSRNRFNVFMTDLFNNTDTKQVSQLTNMAHSNATQPMPYNSSYFTFISEENGIANRWAGFFSTQRNGLDTLYHIGDQLLRNPDPNELDSTLKVWQKQEPDSISYFQVYKDSTYSFPITNNENNILETRVAGYNNQITEVLRDDDEKDVYKLKVDENTLNRRNINLRPTKYVQERWGNGEPKKDIGVNGKQNVDSAGAKEKKEVFQSDFVDEKTDNEKNANKQAINEPKNPLLANEKKAKLFNYRRNFNTDYFTAGVSNSILINQYQPYAGGSGPIQLGTGSDLNWNFRVGTSDLFENLKFIGGVRFTTDLKDKDVFFSFQNLSRMVDWGFTYYRSTNTNFHQGFTPDGSTYDNKSFTNIFQLNATIPLNEIQSFRITTGYRTDRLVLRPYVTSFTVPQDIAYDLLQYPDSIATTWLSRFEFVHDNTLNPTQNIWDGLRFKVYTDMNLPVRVAGYGTKYNFNFGFDARNYVKLYRNFIWATRAAGDFSWGRQKICYYLGGVDGWIGPNFINNQPKDQNYAYQSLAVNMRGYDQNIANGNNAVVINNEFRLPVFATFLNSPINNAFVRNFQVIQFIDLGTAWNGKYNGIKRPSITYTSSDTGNVYNPSTVTVDAGGIGPFAGGYGFGVRSTVLGYFLKFDLAWPMKGVFVGTPKYYFALGLDF